LLGFLRLSQPNTIGISARHGSEVLAEGKAEQKKMIFFVVVGMGEWPDLAPRFRYFAGDLV
jgi:hypothetical protein